MSALATEVLAIFVQLGEARKQVLVEHAHQLLAEQQAEERAPSI